jgi:hypothetical protein
MFLLRVVLVRLLQRYVLAALAQPHQQRCMFAAFGVGWASCKRLSSVVG